MQQVGNQRSEHEATLKRKLIDGNAVPIRIPQFFSFCLQSRLKILIPSVLLMGQLMALGSKHNSTASDPSARPALSAEMLRLPMQFEPNAGQTDSQVQFLSRSPGYTLFFTPTEAVL